MKNFKFQKQMCLSENTLKKVIFSSYDLHLVIFRCYFSTIQKFIFYHSSDNYILFRSIDFPFFKNLKGRSAEEHQVVQNQIKSHRLLQIDANTWNSSDCDH